MTKIELVKLLDDFPDDMNVKVGCGFNHRDPAGDYHIEKVYLWMDCIIIEPYDD